jgi:xylulokinase
MAGIGAVDEDFKPAIRFDSWLDMRCQPFIEWLDREAGDLVTCLTGCPPTCNHGPKMLWWQHEQPQAFERIARFLTPAAYVAGRLCGLKGEQAFIDHTFIHFSGFSDAQRVAWSPELCQRFGMDPYRLPEIVEPWKVVGELTDGAAADFGLAAGTPVAAGAGDTAASALGAGIVQSGMVFDVAGTASVLAGCIDQFVADERQRALLTMRSVIPGLWHPLAYIAGGGLALRWFRDQFFAALTDRVEPDRGDLYSLMDEMAASVSPGADGLKFSPHLGGRICPAAPEMRGAWLGFSWGHTQAHFYRAILESVAYEYAYYLRILKELLSDRRDGVSIRDVACYVSTLVEARVIGGGARSQVWNQIKADVLGIPYQRLAGKEFGTWGAAMIAGKAVGIYTDLAQTASEHTKTAGAAVQPDQQNHVDYQVKVNEYIKMQEGLVGYYRGSHGWR